MSLQDAKFEQLLDELFTFDEQNLLLEGLARLLEIKEESLKTLNAEFKHPSGRPFTPHDFGIPQIEKLLVKIGGEV